MTSNGPVALQLQGPRSLEQHGNSDAASAMSDFEFVTKSSTTSTSQIDWESLENEPSRVLVDQLRESHNLRENLNDQNRKVADLYTALTKEFEQRCIQNRADAEKARQSISKVTEEKEEWRRKFEELKAKCSCALSNPTQPQSPEVIPESSGQPANMSSSSGYSTSSPSVAEQQFREHIAKLEKELKMQKNTNQTLLKSNKDKKGKIEGLERQCEALRENSTNNAQLSELRQLLADKTAELEQMNQEVRTINLHKLPNPADIKQAMEELNAEVDELNSELEKAEVELSTGKEQHAVELEKVKQRSQEEIETYQIQATTFQSDYQMEASEKRELLDKVKKMETDMAALKRECSTYKQKLADAEQRLMQTSANSVGFPGSGSKIGNPKPATAQSPDQAFSTSGSNIIAGFPPVNSTRPKEYVSAATLPPPPADAMSKMSISTPNDDDGDMLTCPFGACNFQTSDCDELERHVDKSHNE